MRGVVGDYESPSLVDSSPAFPDHPINTRCTSGMTSCSATDSKGADLTAGGFRCVGVFRESGPRYQSRMNAVLRSYMERTSTSPRKQPKKRGSPKTRLQQMKP